MAYLRIGKASIPHLAGKTALITGGASGIGFAAAAILASRGATVHCLDRRPPSAEASIPPVTEPLPDNIHFHQCDVTQWTSLRSIFAKVGSLDYVFANAGVSESENFLDDMTEDGGDSSKLGTTVSISQLKEPSYPVFEVNLRGVLNTVKLAHHSMKHSGTKGSIVITSSATAYAPEQSLPVYSATKLALIGLVRSLRNNLKQDNITINAVVPAATESALIAREFVEPIRAAGLPMSSAHHVGLALVYSAIAWENRKVEIYGKDAKESLMKGGPWNGRVILTLGDTYTELEEPIANLSSQWFGDRNLELTKKQQAMTDFRKVQ